MSRQNPKYFTIKVDEIDNGFIVTFENKSGCNQAKSFCKDSEAIIGQVRTWIDLVFEKQNK